VRGSASLNKPSAAACHFASALARTWGFLDVNRRSSEAPVPGDHDRLHALLAHASTDAEHGDVVDSGAAYRGSISPPVIVRPPRMIMSFFRSQM